MRGKVIYAISERIVVSLCFARALQKYICLTTDGHQPERWMSSEM